MKIQSKDHTYMDWPDSDENIIQVIRWKDNQPVEIHRHDFIEIAFIASGSCYHTYHGSKIKLVPGDLYVITPHEEHGLSVDSTTVIYNCLFYPEALGNDWANIKDYKGIYDMFIVEPFYRSESTDQEIVHLSPLDAHQVEELLKKMIEEQDHKLEGYQLVRKSYLLTLLCMLGRAWQKQFIDRSIAYHSKRDMLSKAISYIEKNVDTNINTDAIASKVYLSPSYFRKVFKEATGLTPIDYINTLRISKAKQLLIQSNLTISEIALAVGINDHNYFSRLFKSIAACSPSEYRKRDWR